MPIRKTGVTVLGWMLVVLGIIAMPLPGPGLLILLAGLVVLSQEYEWAERRVEPVKKKAFDLAKAGVSTYPKIVISAVGACSLIALGVLLGLDPRIPHLFTIPQIGPIGAIEVGPQIPFSSWATGSSFIFSGLVALGLLIYSVKRWRGEALRERRRARETHHVRKESSTAA